MTGQMKPLMLGGQPNRAGDPMSGNGNGNGNGNGHGAGGGTDSAAIAFLNDLQQSGFFEQVKDLQNSVGMVATDLKDLGARATERLEETESLATHILAIEAILTVLLKAAPVDRAEVSALIQGETSKMTGGDGANTLVESVAMNLIDKATEAEA